MNTSHAKNHVTDIPKVIGIFTAIPASAYPGYKNDPISASIRRITLFGVFFIICLVTTIIATSLIILKIWMSSRHSCHSPFSYKRLGAILVESGALYSTVLLGQTILAAINWAYTPVNAFRYEARYNAATEVIACLMMPVTVSTSLPLKPGLLWLSVIQGFAPTLIALRVGREIVRTDGSAPVSHMSFRRSRQSVTRLGGHHEHTISMPGIIFTRASTNEGQEIESSNMSEKEIV